MSGEEREDPRVIAERENLELVLPDQYTLFIDLDTPDRKVFDKNLKLLNDGKIYGHFTLDKETKSRGGGTHLYVRCNRPIWNPLERLFLQAVLGSDLTHELMSYEDVVIGDEIATCFFEVKHG